MRTLLLTPVLLLVPETAATAAPALSDKPKWEYAELTFRNVPGRPGGVDADGKEVPATPASVSIRWITGAGEVDVKGWDELADKLKAPALKKGSAAFSKIQVLNYLGSEGWELMEQQTSGSAAALFDGPGGRGPGRGPGADRGPGGDRGTGADFPGFRPSPATGTWLLKRRVP
jgi:hypothetical protein